MGQLDGKQVAGTVLTDGTRAMSGDLDAGNQDVKNAQTYCYNTEDNDGNQSGTYNLSWATGGRRRCTLTGNVTTLNLTAPPGVTNLVLKVIQDSTGGRTITWPSSVKWPGGGTAPTLSTAANAVDIITFYYDGTNYYGSAAYDFQ